jgi:uncharacterized delta-60 repeat protein
MRLFYSFLMAALLSCGPWVSAVAQQLDPSFAPSFITSVGGSVQAMVKQPDGKVIISGQFQTMNGEPTSQVARLNADGSPDLAFRTQTGSGPDQLISALAVQPDGKILLGSEHGLSFYNGVPVQGLVRLNADGSLDTSFTSGGAGWLGYIRSLAVQLDGKILVGGSLYATFNGQPTHGLIRLLPSGALDTSFNTGTGFVGTYGDQVVIKLLVQPDGKIVAAGSFTSFNGQSRSAIARLNTNGSLDTTFNASLDAQGIILALDIQPDGKLVVGGAQLGSSTSAQLLRRLLPTGATDATFQGGPQNGGVILDLHVRANGSILVAGGFGDYGGVARSGLARASSTGALDASFAATTSSGGALMGVVELNNGQHLIGGYFNEFDGQGESGLARLTTAGRFDASYGQPLGYIPGSALVPQTNGQVLLNFAFSRFNGQTVTNNGYPAVHRVNANGTYNALVTLPAATLRPTGGYYLYNVFPQPDGTFYATYQNSDSTSVARHILANGTFDPAFAATVFQGSAVLGLQGVYSITVQPSSSLLVYGSFTKVNGQPRKFVARLLATGAPDTQFAPPANAVWQVPNAGMGSTAGFREAVGFANGQTLVLWSDATRCYLARLNSDGSTDNTFSIGTSGGPTANFGIRAVAGGKVLVNGDFTTFNGQAAPNGLVRLLPTGAPDAGFTAASASRYTVEQPDGRLLIVAPGTTPQNVSIVRLLDNGGLDSSFQPVPVLSATSAPAFPVLSLQPVTQAILLSGNFTSVAGQARYGLARLVNTALATRAATAVPPADAFPNPAHDQLSLRLPAPPTGPVLLADLQGRTVRRWQLAQASGTVPLSGLAPGVYLLRIATTAGHSWQRVVVE